MRVLLIAYDNGSHIPFFPQGMAYIAGTLLAKGHDVRLWLQDVEHYPDEWLTNHLDRVTQLKFDVVCLGFNAGYYQYQKCLSLAKAVNRSKNRESFKFVLGGHGPAAAPEYFLGKFEADSVVIGEGEGVDWDTIGREDVVTVQPIKDVDAIQWPLYRHFPINVYRLIRWPTSRETDLCMPVLSGRGCPYRCTFCYRMFEGDFRPRSPEAVIDEMEYLHFNYGINHFQFSDELFMSSRARVHTFCEALMRVKIKGFKWDCNGRLNFADVETLKIMQRSGCEYVNYGVEAIDDDVLKNIRKGLTVRQIERGVKNTVGMGLVPGINLMWGNPGDSSSTLWRAVNFLTQYDTCAELRTIRPMTPYPGSQAFKDSGMTPAEFYEERHVNSDLLTVNHTELTDEMFHAELCEANDRLVRNYYMRKHDQISAIMDAFYSGKNTQFRGFRPI